MAPRAKLKVAPDGFLAIQNGKKVQCIFCTAASPIQKEIAIEWPSLANHLASDKHKRAEEQARLTRTRAARIQQEQEDDLARRREADMQFSALQDVAIPEPTRHPQIQTAAEARLWEQLDTDPHAAGFDLGVDKTTQQYNSLCNEMNSLWNAGIMGKDSGFALGEGNEPEDFLEEDEADEFLAEIMQNAGATSSIVD